MTPSLPPLAGSFDDTRTTTSQGLGHGLKTSSGAVNNIRDSVKYVKSSQSRKQRFEEIVSQVDISYEKSLSLDAATRWNSTFLMIKTALEFRRAFDALQLQDPLYKCAPSVEQWERAEAICNLLEVFYDATMVVSGSSYPTTTCYFHEIWKVKLMLEREAMNQDSIIISMVHEMKAKFLKYWKLSYLPICIPIILDPRFKYKFLEFRLRNGFEEEASRYLSHVKRTIKELFAEYSSHVDDSSISNEQGRSDVEINADINDPWADWNQHLNAQQRNRAKSELDRYLKENVYPQEAGFDILQ